ncbi:hypothetical protein B0O80DRAFT_495986 [Mortierella sp. GBAus27b]|nr:hypothetical protein B0O80DRAFT_495986 [Mortierella sp. GBAus27b]
MDPGLMEAIKDKGFQATLRHRLPELNSSSKALSGVQCRQRLADLEVQSDSMDNIKDYTCIQKRLLKKHPFFGMGHKLQASQKPIRDNKRSRTTFGKVKWFCVADNGIFDTPVGVFNKAEESLIKCNSAQQVPLGGTNRYKPIDKPPQDEYAASS